MIGTKPPVTLTDEAMKLAAALLQIAADPQAAKSAAGRTGWTDPANLRAAITQHAAAKKQAEAATTALADVERRARDLASREESLIKARR